MVRVDILRDDDILRCSEGNRVWYRLWIGYDENRTIIGGCIIFSSMR